MQTQNTYTKVVSIDSRDRYLAAHQAVNGLPNDGSIVNPNDYTIQLPAEYKTVVGARLMSLELPTTYANFGINSSGWSTQVSINNGAWQTVTVSAKYYPTANTLATAFQTAINGLSSLTSGTITGVAVTAGVISFTVTVPVSINSNGHDFANQLGFSLGTTTSSGSTLTASYPVGGVQITTVSGGSSSYAYSLNYQTERYIFLDIPLLNHIDECIIGGGMSATQKTAFARIPNNVGQGSMQYLNTINLGRTDETYIQPPIARLDRLKIRWRFHDGTLVDFLGQDHSFCLELRMLG